MREKEVDYIRNGIETNQLCIIITIIIITITIIAIIITIIMFSPFIR